jgi:serine/threonine-protein kinase
VIGDQQQVLAEIKLDDARANRDNVGRWTGQTLGGTWRLGMVLGRGAMGEVYEGIAADGREAAVKLLADPQTSGGGAILDRFHREMKLAATLSSPHIVHVYEVSQPSARMPYIVMERLRGHDLAAKLRNELRMELREVLTMLEQLAQGLEVAHAAGVIHRDLKPHNVFCHDGVWKFSTSASPRSLAAKEPSPVT